LINAKLSMLLAAFVMAVATAACSGPEKTASQAMPAETPMAGPNEFAVADTAAVDSGTTDFVERAVNSNMFEIEASKIALERSKVQPVKTSPRCWSMPTRQRWASCNHFPPPQW